jgi:hypothetical protein
VDGLALVPMQPRRPSTRFKAAGAPRCLLPLSFRPSSFSVSSSSRTVFSDLFSIFFLSPPPLTERRGVLRLKWRRSSVGRRSTAAISIAIAFFVLFFLDSSPSAPPLPACTTHSSAACPVGSFLHPPISFFLSFFLFRSSATATSTRYSPSLACAAAASVL